MRALIYLISCVAVIGVAYWAYNENYRTRESITRVKVLQADIAAARTSISVLKAEWAYLNRPDRLRDLVDLNFEDLRLLPLLPEHFADITLVAYPPLNLRVQDIQSPVSVQSVDDEEFP